ncbi:hypothetical protein TNCV_4535621 [Trichonephila clavipes]|nr:hypothetical protein TNCV_4535621 [Trichonephila clavipes]
MDLIILNHGQATRTTPKLSTPLLTTTLHQGSSVTPGLELMARQPQVCGYDKRSLALFRYIRLQSNPRSTTIRIKK